MGGNIHSMKLGAITSRDPARRRSGLSEGDAGARGARLGTVPTPHGWRQKRQSEALPAATAEYRRLSPWAAGDDSLAVSAEVNRIAAAINVDRAAVGSETT
jgi:hypothetical protein